MKFFSISYLFVLDTPLPSGKGSIKLSYDNAIIRFRICHKIIYGKQFAKLKKLEQLGYVECDKKGRSYHYNVNLDVLDGLA